MRVDKSSMPNESESFNSYQLSSSFGRGLMPDVAFVENLSNRSSRVQIPWDICTHFGCYLYSTECS